MSAERNLRKHGTSLSVHDLVHDSIQVFEPYSTDKPISDRFVWAGDGKVMCRGARPFAIPFPTVQREQGSTAPAPIVIPGLTVNLAQYTGRRSKQLALTAPPTPSEPRFAQLKNRVRSLVPHFEDCTPAEVEMLAIAGFYWDEVGMACFWCQTRLLKFSSTPVEEHHRLAPQCPFIRGMMVRTPTAAEREKAVGFLMLSSPVTDLLETGFDESVLRRVMSSVYDGRHASPKPRQLLDLLSADQLASHKSVVSDGPKLACRVCMDSQIDVLLLPCGHLCTCLECSNELRTCPVCRTKITARHIAKL